MRSSKYSLLEFPQQPTFKRDTFIAKQPWRAHSQGDKAPDRANNIKQEDLKQEDFKQEDLKQEDLKQEDEGVEEPLDDEAVRHLTGVKNELDKGRLSIIRSRIETLQKAGKELSESTLRGLFGDEPEDEAINNGFSRAKRPKYKGNNLQGTTRIHHDFIVCRNCTTRGHSHAECNANLVDGFLELCPFCTDCEHLVENCPRVKAGTLTRANAYLGLVKARAGRAPVRQPWHPWEIDPERFERERAAGITLPQTPQFAHDGFMQRGLQELNESIPDPV